MAILPSVFDEENEFNVWMRRLAWPAVVVLLILVVFFQQFLSGLSGMTLSKPPQSILESEAVEDPGVGPLAIDAKIIVKLFYEELQGRSRTEAERDNLQLSEELPIHFQVIEKEAQEAIKDLDRIAISRTDRVRLAILAAEVLGPAEAVRRLEAIEGELLAGGDLANEVYWLKSWYTAQARWVTDFKDWDERMQAEYENARRKRIKWVESPPPKKPDPIGVDVQVSLESRHGWFGELAASYGRHASDATRWNVIRNGAVLMSRDRLLNIGGVLSLLVGIGLCVWFWRRDTDGELMLDSVQSAVPRTLYAEMFAFFLLCFLVFVVLGVMFVGETSIWTAIAPELLIWAVSLSMFWPLLRGVSWSEFRSDVGWNRGEGLAKEIKLGVFVFLAERPLIVLLSIAIAAASAAFKSQESAVGVASEFPAFESPLSNSWMMLVFGAVSSMLWAPFVEETLVRGALHRAMPDRWGMFVRVGISSVIFGMIHPYSIDGMLMVGVGGFVYGTIREWRGSLIAPMTAHCLHNASIALTQIFVLSALD